MTRALRAEIEESLRSGFDQALAKRERELRESYDERVAEEVKAAQRDAAARAEKTLERELGELNEQIVEQARALEEARRQELALRRRERELEQKQQDLELTVTREMDRERARIVAEAQERIGEQHRLKEAEKDRQLTELRRQIEDLKRRAEQGSQQLQGEAGECELETILRASFPHDDLQPVVQGARGADLHQIIIDARGVRCAAILWECKNAKHWSDAWLQKLKADQRSLHADVAVLVTASLPKGLARFGLVEGVLVCDFASAVALAAVVRANLLQLSQARNAAINKGEKLELLHRYLSGVQFRQRVEAIVEAFSTMRADLEQERRAAERAWARRARQLEAVTLGVAGMYGDLQGLVPGLPVIPLLGMPDGGDEEEVA
ncbi:MAG TPA: DUF2130 domain-containing protein [Vicinamibacterales bacterium]|nr:DUF2130 domain-containing protein [Vicinamibacterales bacterium]